MAAAMLLVGGCSLSIVPQADPHEPAATERGVLVFGRITYTIEGQAQLPYGASRPAPPPPHLDLLRIEDGNPFQTYPVNRADGSFVWRIRPGHYVVTGIGPGQLTDDHRIVWPRLAFDVRSGATSQYLGHLELVGTRYTRTYTLSTGTRSVSAGIDYEARVIDELDRTPPATGSPPRKSLIFHRPNMLIGDRLYLGLQASREQVIREIFEP
jgi:hypothetical protein